MIVKTDFVSFILFVTARPETLPWSEGGRAFLSASKEASRLKGRVVLPEKHCRWEQLYKE